MKKTMENYDFEVITHSVFHKEEKEQMIEKTWVKLKGVMILSEWESWEMISSEFWIQKGWLGTESYFFQLKSGAWDNPNAFSITHHSLLTNDYQSYTSHTR